MREILFNLLKDETPKEEEIFDISLGINDNNYLDDLFKDINTKKEYFLNLKAIKLIYKNKKTIHELLYNKEIIIPINFNIKNMNLSFLFYLDLLIMDNKNFINYTYPYQAIIKINKMKDIHREKNINKKDKKINNIILIIISKIVHDLIINYKGFDEFDERNQNELNKIEEDNKKILEKYIHYLNELNINWNLNDIYKKNLDEIYKEIIVALFKEAKEDDYQNENLKMLLEHLDLESMSITETMNEKFFNILNSELNLNNYIITEDIKNRLFKEKIINFNYFLLKYILKESDIYQIPLFLKSRNIILKLIKSNTDKNKLYISDLDKGIKQRYEYILKKLLNSKYYEKYINDILYCPKKNKNNEKIQILINNKNNNSSSYWRDYSNDEIKKLSPKIKEFENFEFKELEGLLFNGRKIINEEIIVFTINDSEKIGKDILVFYNIKKEKIVKKIEGYFFTKGETSLDITNNENNKYLICLCRLDLINGLLMIDLDILKNKIKIKKDEKFIKFFPIDFSSKSICCIKNYTEEQNSLDYNKNYNYYYDHEFVLLGGVRNTIKLYKLKYNEDFQKIKLKYLREIELFEISIHPKNSINYIKQNKENGKIIIGIEGKFNELEIPSLDDDYNESLNLSEIHRNYSYREI